MQNVLFVNPVICISNRTREHMNDGIAKLISTPVHWNKQEACIYLPKHWLMLIWNASEHRACIFSTPFRIPEFLIFNFVPNTHIFTYLFHDLNNSLKQMPQ